MKYSLSKTASCVSVLVLAALAGCQSAPKVEPAGDDPASISIKESIERSSKDMAFTASSQASAPPALMKGPTVSLTFAGDAKTLLSKVAAANGLKFNIVGPQPHLPLFVTVNVSNVPMEFFLRDVAEQFGQRAALALNESTLEIRYRGNSTSK